MLSIGIDISQGLIYEGVSPYARAVWPSPLITPAKIVFESEGPLIAERTSDPITSACRFREDFYDPISRIRRGRFYFAEGHQPAEWFVQPHPALPSERGANNAAEIRKPVHAFMGNPIWYQYIKGRTEQPLVLLGLEDRFTIWKIVDIEAISTGEDLVTLKARGSLGILPEIDRDKVPKHFQTRLFESLDSFADETRRSAPVSVIDRARDAASQILLAYYDADGQEALDLARMAKRLETEEKAIAFWAAKIIARLHARAKPVERAKRSIPPVREQDAEFAIQCVGTILCEIGWAEWA